MAMMYKAALVDFDGTLADLFRGTAIKEHVVVRLRRLYGEAGVSPALLSASSPYRMWLEGFTALKDSPQCAAIVQEEASAIIEEGELTAGGSCDLFRGVDRAVLELFTKGVRLAVVSMNSTAVIHHVLSKHGVAEMFQVVAGRTRKATLAQVKPAAPLVRRVLTDLGAADTTVCVVGDSVDDMRMAKGERLRAIGVLTGQGTAAALVAAGAHHLCASFVGVPRLIFEERSGGTALTATNPLHHANGRPVGRP